MNFRTSPFAGSTSSKASTEETYALAVGAAALSATVSQAATIAGVSAHLKIGLVLATCMAAQTTGVSPVTGQMRGMAKSVAAVLVDVVVVMAMAAEVIAFGS